jgi:hypothetical protein
MEITMTTQSVKSIILDLLQEGHRTETAFVQALDESERAAIGTPQCWSAKDHLAHMAHCLDRNLIHQVSAILQQQEAMPREASVDLMNARVFAENQLRPWSEIHASFEQVHVDLIRLVERLSEADLMDTQRFSAICEGRPLYVAFFGNGYEHLQEHLMQYYLDRHDLSQATRIREQCTNSVVQRAAPSWVKAWFLCKLAGFYAEQQQREKAIAPLQQALSLAPDFINEWLKHEPGLAALRDQPA